MRKLIPALLVSVLTATGCHRSNESTDIDHVPVGTDVQVTRQDGGLVEGRLAARDESAVRVEKGATTRSVPRKEIAEVRVSPPSAPAPSPGPADDAAPVRVARPEPPPRATFREVTIPASAKLAIRLQSDVSSERSRVEDVVRAELSEPVIVDGDQVLPAGAALKGVVTEAVPAGRVKGRASLGLHFTTITADGTDYPIDARFARTAESTARGDAEKIGIPAVGGAVIGAIIGGKKGAAIGAAAGGGAGAAVVLTTPGEPISLAEGTILSLTIGDPVDVKVKLR